VQRNWDLIRKLLIKIEETEGYGNWITPHSIPENPHEQVAYHIGLLIEAGYANGKKSSDFDLMRDFCATSLTWQGHEFLDKIRSDTVWKKTKATALEKGIDLSVEVVSTIASRVIERLLYGN